MNIKVGLPSALFLMICLTMTGIIGCSEVSPKLVPEVPDQTPEAPAQTSGAKAPSLTPLEEPAKPAPFEWPKALHI